MKRNLLILLLAIFFVSFLSCSKKTKMPEKPEDTTLEFWITEDVADVDFSGYKEIPGWFGAKQFFGTGYDYVTVGNGMIEDPEYYVKYLISAYPDYADGGHFVTEIEITDPNVSVYGLTVNSTFDEFDTVFDKMEYTIEREEERSSSSHSAVKDGLYFILKDMNGKRVLSIRATVTNREDIMF